MAKATQTAAKVAGKAKGAKADGSTRDEIFPELRRNAIEGHVDREEKELFPRAADLLTSDKAREMEERYEGAEEFEKRTR